MRASIPYSPEPTIWSASYAANEYNRFLANFLETKNFCNGKRAPRLNHRLKPADFMKSNLKSKNFAENFRVNFERHD